ncbi:hypothetical protein FZEAL_4733 [Fusarium zealandicum]|uniref:Uncharacterized protein n=1 Tax=Fusarium zealandicum TaxID=1053134 RepID=A0A8H4XKI8_9HYPO|nr:hypothetical protein FZEAL_4733 [Fusarium zealandicum]
MSSVNPQQGSAAGVGDAPTRDQPPESKVVSHRRASAYSHDNVIAGIQARTVVIQAGVNGGMGNDHDLTELDAVMAAYQPPVRQAGTSHTEPVSSLFVGLGSRFE